MVPNIETLCCQSIPFLSWFHKIFSTLSLHILNFKAIQVIHVTNSLKTGYGKGILFTDKDHKRFRKRNEIQSSVWRRWERWHPACYCFCAQRWRVLWFPDKQNSWSVRCVTLALLFESYISGFWGARGSIYFHVFKGGVLAKNGPFPSKSRVLTIWEILHPSPFRGNLAKIFQCCQKSF